MPRLRNTLLADQHIFDSRTFASCLKSVQCILAWVTHRKNTVISRKETTIGFLWNGLRCFTRQTSRPEENIRGIWAILKITSPPWLSKPQLLVEDCNLKASWMCISTCKDCALFSLKCAVTVIKLCKGRMVLGKNDFLAVGTHPFSFGILCTRCAFSFLGHCPAG